MIELAVRKRRLRAAFGRADVSPAVAEAFLSVRELVEVVVTELAGQDEW